MTQSALLPDRHQPDFFIADIFDSLPVKNDRHTMEHPFFTLSTKKDVRVIHYEKDGISIFLSPSTKDGLPTMMDKDILLYCGSLVMAEINKGNHPPKTLRFSAHDLMVTTNRETNGKAYKLLKSAFERLKGVSITTNIETNNVKLSKGFGLIDQWEIIEKSHDNSRMVKLEVTLSDWFYNSLIGKEVLTINRDYFRLRKTLERRIYELARKHCGKQKEWQIHLKNLRAKVGSLSALYKFRYQLRSIIETDAKEGHFPDYQLALNGDTDMVTVTPKKSPKHERIMPDELPMIKRETIIKGERIVRESGTGWCYDNIREQFTKQLIDGFQPNTVDGSFIGFVKDKVKTAP